MLRFARFVAAVFAFPFIWALCHTFKDAVYLASGNSQSLFSAESIALFSGLVLFLAIWKAFPVMTRIYVLGHELTHALWGLAFGAKVSNLKVRSTGGSVMLTKSNVWITLAPYFFPFWTMIVVLIALATRGVICLFNSEMPFPVPWLWMFAIGFTWCFHICFTIRSLMQTQSDVQEYGRVFSWTLILACNIAGILLWIICTTDVPTIAIFKCLCSHTAATYQHTFQILCEWISLIRNEIHGAPA